MRIVPTPAAASEGDAKADVEPPASGQTYAVATTGVIDIVGPVDDLPDLGAGTTAEVDGDDDAWLADIRPIDPESDEGEIAPPDDGGGDLTDASPQEQPEQPSSLSWESEPIAPEHDGEEQR